MFRFPNGSTEAACAVQGGEAKMSDHVRIDPDGVYSISAVARFLHVSPSTLRDLERQGKLACTRTPGGQRRFVGAEILRMLKESADVSAKKAASTSTHVATTTEDAKEIGRASCRERV